MLSEEIAMDCEGVVVALDVLDHLFDGPVDGLRPQTSSS